jgi:hypothetical protein
MQDRLSASPRTGAFAAIIAATILAFAALTVVAGLPPAEQIPSFVIGMIVLVAVTAAIGALGWHLMLRPISLPVTAQAILTMRERQFIALLLTLATFSFGIAAVWDEIWHVKYGIPFGDDFFWRPHLMLYFSFMSFIGVGGWSWWVLMARGKGTLQQRFRGEPILGVSFLVGAYTIYAIGADPIWHSLYGADIAPWSVPHLLILVLMLLAAVLTLAYHKSLMPERGWQFMLNWRDVLMMLVLAGPALAYLLIFTLQWYAAPESVQQLSQITSYPNWLLAVFITFLATVFGVTILHATRRLGSATLLGLLIVAVRFVMDTSLGSPRAGTVPMGFILPMLVGLDVWYAISIRRTGQPPVFWTSAGATTLAFAVVGLPVIASLLPYPPITPATIPGLVIACAVTALGSIWLGQILGDLGEYGQKVVATETAVRPWTATNLLYAAYAVFLVFWIATAVPPVA